MESNELMIGNYITDVWASPGSFFQVKYIQRSCTYGADYKAAYENLTPIPLTEEWLLSFGFEKLPSETDSKYHGNNALNFGYPVLFLNRYEYLATNSKGNSSGNLFLNGLKIECKYVHQLQNLYYALTGQKLTKKP